MNPYLRGTLIVISLLLIFSLIIIGLGSALTPLICSFALAYLVFPLIKKLEQKGIPRAAAVSGIFAIIVLISVLVLVIVIPILVEDANGFIRELPQNTRIVIEKTETFAASFGIEIDMSLDRIKAYISEHINEISSDLIKNITKTIKGTFTNILGWILAILNIFLIPLFFFYVINDYEKISRELTSFVPMSIRPKLTHYFRLANRVLSGYIRGQLLVALILGGLYGIGLAIVGLRFGFFIGFISGLLCIIPYVGFAVGFVTAIMVAIANDPQANTFIGIIAVFTIAQMLEGFVITPNLVGDKVGLSALATILALIIGGNLFGLPGMLLAIPTAAILKVILADLKKEYQTLELYQSE